MDHREEHAQFSPPAAAEPPAAERSDDDVLKVIADVEQRLATIRDMQQSSNEQLVSLEDRARSLSEKEQTLAAQAGEVESLKVDLHRQQAEMAEARQDLDQQREVLSRSKEELERRQSELEAQQAEIAARDQRENEELASLRHEQEQVAQRTAELQSAMQNAEARAAEAAHQLDIARQERAGLDERFAHLEGELHQARENAQEANEELGAFRSERDQTAARIGELEQAVADARTARDQAERDGLELAEQAEARGHALQERLEAMESERNAINAAHDEMRERAESLSSRVESLEHELGARDQRQSETQQKLELATTKLGQFAEAFTAQAPELERGAAALATVQEQQREIERLRQELVSQGEAPDEALREKDTRIEQLEAAVQQLHNELETARNAAGEHSPELQAEAESMRSRIAELQAEAESMRSRIAELESALANAEHAPGVDPAEAEALRNRIGELDSAAAAHAQANAEVADLRARIAQLDQELETTRSGVPAEDGEYATMMAELQEKGRRIQTVAQHLQRRRDRLVRLRKLLRDRPAASPKSEANHGELEARAKQVREIHAQREALVEARRCLGESEKRMVRQWARQRSVTVLFFLAAVAALVGVGSWFASGHFAPTPLTASVTLEAKAREGATLSEDALAEWQEWHATTAMDPQFISSVAKRAGSRGLESASNAAALEARLRKDLTLDEEEPGQLTMTLAGTRPDEVTASLDILATSLAIESSRQRDLRPGSARAAMVGEVREPGRIRYAMVNPTAVLFDETRMMLAGGIFGVGMLLCIVMIVFVYGRLVRVKRVFDEEEAAILAQSLDVA